ncbi:MAG: nuclease-related domain-containing protein [Clostridia bacterium]
MFRFLRSFLILYQIALMNVKILVVWSFLRFFQASSSNIKLRDVGKLFDISLYKEFMTFYKIDKISFYKRILARLSFENYDGRERVIDLVIISEKGIYSILTSDRKGVIKGNCESLQWVENHDGSHNKFYNPVWFNQTNIELLADNLGLDKKYFISVIIFKNKCQLKEIVNMPENVVVVKKDNVKEALEADFEKRDPMIDKEEIDLIFDKVKKHVKLQSKLEEEHYKNIEKKY